MNFEFERKEVKAKAKENLKNNLGICILVLGLFPMLLSIPSALTEVFGIEISGIYGLLFAIIAIPLEIGFAKFALNIARGGNADINNVWEGFELILKGIGVSILMGIVVLIGTMLFIVPGIILAYCFYYALTILADNPSIGVIDCLKESYNLTSGYKLQLFVLDLSFFGWALLIAITFGLAFLWVGPYMTLTQTEVYLEIKRQKDNILQV